MSIHRDPDAPYEETRLIIASVVDTHGKSWVGLQIGRARWSIDPDTAQEMAGGLLECAAMTQLHRDDPDSEVATRAGAYPADRPVPRGAGKRRES